MNKTQINNCRLFASYAGDNLDIWKTIEEQQVTHNTFGCGSVVSVKEGKSSNSLYILVRFDDLPPHQAEKRFPKDSLGDDKFFSDLTLPDDLEGIELVREQLLKQQQIEEQQKKLAEKAARQLENQRKQKEQQRQREAASARHFAELKSKYLVTAYPDSSPSSQLYKILVQLEEGEELENRDIGWLEQKQLFQVVALFYENRLRKHDDKWNIARASKYWRKAKKPHRALMITEEVESTDDKLMSAISTSRGAAFRDTKDLPKAKQCAADALDYNRGSFHAHNLLGAIYYQNGQPEQGDECFQKAVELGASTEIQEHHIRTALANSEGDRRKHAARYLLQKDPIRYKWAEYYLE